MKYSFGDECVLAFCRLGLAGLAPVAPGTCGSALACVLAPWLYLPFGPGSRLALLALVFGLGALAAGRAEKLLQMRDPGQVVIDELLGVWVVLLPFADPGFRTIFCAFALFRIFDIIKPWPVCVAEHWLPGGFGVMLDDLVAGLLALVFLLLLRAAGMA